VQQGADYFIPHRCLIQPLANQTGFRPDVIVLDRAALCQEPLWASQPVVTLGSTVKWVAGVVSSNWQNSNWQNDHAHKLEDYALLGIPEYWIADYQGLGGECFIGLTRYYFGDVSVHRGVGFLNKPGKDQRLLICDQTVAQTTAEFRPSPPQSP
jgi:Uma2 family endonuclease